MGGRPQPSKAHAADRAAVHTGMSRLGIPPEERSALADALEQEDNLEILFIMSHLASADDKDSEQNADQ